MADFYPHYPKEWRGRYNRIFGNNDSVFHIILNEKKKGWVLSIYKTNESEKLEYIAEESNATIELIRKVNNLKRKWSRNAGGSFIINEFNQVIVPSSKRDVKRFLIGEFYGSILFKNPITGYNIDLDNDSEYECGDSWAMPYVGCQYLLTKSGEIGVWNETDDRKELQLVENQDYSLIEKLRSIRGKQGGRFIVNPHGIVLTKKGIRSDEWIPIYVGRIDYNKWFEKEE